jgi:hypothetical protein
MTGDRDTYYRQETRTYGGDRDQWTRPTGDYTSRSYTPSRSYGITGDRDYTTRDYTTTSRDYPTTSRDYPTTTPSRGYTTDYPTTRGYPTYGREDTTPSRGYGFTGERDWTSSRYPTTGDRDWTTSRYTTNGDRTTGYRGDVTVTYQSFCVQSKNFSLFPSSFSVVLYSLVRNSLSLSKWHIIAPNITVTRIVTTRPEDGDRGSVWTTRTVMMTTADTTTSRPPLIATRSHRLTMNVPPTLNEDHPLEDTPELAAVMDTPLAMKSLVADHRGQLTVTILLAHRTDSR